MYWHDVVGIAGVFIILYGYYALQSERISSRDLSYSLLNLIGSTMILCSLYFTWNMASVVIEVVWFFISLYGIIKYFRRTKDA